MCFKAMATLAMQDVVTLVMQERSSRSSRVTRNTSKGSNSDDVNWASMGSENSSSQTRSREGSKSKELARGQTKTSMVSFASFSSESSKQRAMPRWASMAANRSDNEAVKGGVGEKTLLFGPVVGQVSIQEMILDRSYTFLDYVRGGLELRMILGIDFTRSNMDTMNPESLHSLCERGLATAYEDAIVSLGQVLRSYDSSNEYFVYGFGAKIPPSHTVCSNCFALTGDFLYPKVKGLDGILQAYRRALNVVSLHGPSDCVEVLKLAGRFARNFVQEPEKEVLRSTVPPDLIYFVLLILTDGEMESEKQIVEELRNLQAYPISVFFIGIGSKDFSFLRELPNALSLNFDTDFDKPKLENVSKTVSRRVVQFVQYSEYESDPEGLVQATLADLPREIVLYYRMLGVKPRGLERFENKFGELLPTPLPKAAKLELLAAKQRTEDRKTREKVLASKGVREDGASKDTTGSGNRSLMRASSRMSAISAASANVPSTDGDESAVASSRLSLPNAALQEDEEVLQEHQMELSSTSEEDAPKRSKREEDNLPVFLQEERKRLLDEAIAIGYRKHQITRAMRDGIAAATVDVLLDNIRYSGYGKLPSYRDAAISSLPDDAPLPWNPFKTAAENEKKIKQLDVEMEDYGEQLRALTNPAKSELTRQDVLSTAGIFECRRSRIAPPRPPQSPSPKSPPSPPSPSGRLALRHSNSALSNTSPGSPSLRNVEDERREDTGAFEGPGDATKQVEEAARRLRSLRSCAGREGDWPSIKEEDERMHEEDRNIRPPDEPPATLGPPSRSVTKLSSSANSRAYSKGLLE
ncbi:unnamed protein product [Durusdinium trenchii]|uniref:VWFA domain-containing protein n=2 Tax=Durusdinium trenchii TaxID=1381693 RepID=A0ABP0IHL3_9DINO